jgi:hypothetical protein
MIYNAKRIGMLEYGVFVDTGDSPIFASKLKRHAVEVCDLLTSAYESGHLAGRLEIKMQVRDAVEKARVNGQVLEPAELLPSVVHKFVDGKLVPFFPSGKPFKINLKDE